MTLEQGVREGNRTQLARAITLVESTKPDDREKAQELLQKLMPETGRAVRIGISGVPGVGKSTFIEAFGSMLCDKGHRVAVLAVDPSSARTGGSILGDKSRMAELAQNTNAYIRPSPNARTLGGVGRRTRESMLLCEAAGFDVVLVETVGVGQSETMVAEMVDFFLVLMLPGAGDELQGIKRGILELADAIVVNKADGDLLPKAREAQREYASALMYLSRRHEGWDPPALLASAKERTGLDELWEKIAEHQSAVDVDSIRRDQLVAWMWGQVREELEARPPRPPAASSIHLLPPKPSLSRSLE
jgi:LAO/AO transport system kinase